MQHLVDQRLPVLAARLYPDRPHRSVRIRFNEGGIGPLGMHGYPVETSPNCKGYMLLWHDGKPLGGINLGDVSTTQLHATVCEILGIKPAPGADPHPIKLEP